MGGRIVRREPLILDVSDAAREILGRAGWITYFTRFQQPNEAIVIEFLQNLQNGQSMIRGRKITVTNAVITKCTDYQQKDPYGLIKD